jgi:prepilin-type N-terminal cleavage/methylation domain-containing protein
MNKFFERGISLIELVVVIAIGAVLAALSVSAFVNLSNNDIVESATQAIVSQLRTAQRDAVESLGDSTYGIHITSSQAIFFVGSTYQNGLSSNVVFSFPANVTASATPSDFVFQKISGTTTSGTIQIYVSSNHNYEKTISIPSTGVPEVQ